MSNETEFKVNKLYISRPLELIDFLEIKADKGIFTYEAIQFFRELDYVTYKKNCYYVKIYKSMVLYYHLSNSEINFDLTELQKWNDLVASWRYSYEMIKLDESKLPFKPYKFQYDDIKEMLRQHTLLNANDMGCGKTFESVVVGESIRMKKVVICPATLRLNWEKEIKMVNPDADVKVIYNNMLFETGKDWTIIGYSSIDCFITELLKENFQCIFIDEAHFCQSLGANGIPSSKRAKGVLQMAATAGYVYALTGTPKPTRNKDLFNILRLIKHRLVENLNSYYSYGTKFCDPLKTDMGTSFNGNSNDLLLYEELKPRMIRHLKKEVLPHLKKLRMCIPVKIELQEYNKALDEYRELISKQKSNTSEELRIITRAKKILARNKALSSVEFAKDIVSEGDKVIIVTCYTEVVDMITSAFKGNVVKITGGMTDKQKEAAKEEFQKGNTQVMVMNIIAGGAGLTLTSAHKMIFNDYDWTVGNIMQAEDRICRGNQKELCFCYYMTAKGAKEEEKFVDMLTNKSRSINDTVDAGMFGGAIDFRTLVSTA